MDNEIMEFFVGSATVTQSLLLLLGLLENDKNWHHQLNPDHKKIYDQLKYKEQTDEFLEIVFKDNFDSFSEDYLVQELIEELNQLKSQLLNYYFSTILEKSNEFQYFPDSHSKLSMYYIQLQRLKMTISPVFQFAFSTHSVSKIKYLTVRGFWMNDVGEKERKFVKSIGRDDQFKNSKNDPLASKIAVNTLREVMLEEYRKTYPS